jgi:hypothetical protein
MRANDSKPRKVAPLVFASEASGAPVWALRTATAADAPVIAALGIEPSRLGEAVLASLFDGQGGSVVCEASVKGTKEGQGFSGLLLGCAAVDVSSAVRDPAVGFSSGLVRRAEVLAVGVDDRMPSPDNVKRTMILGSMKKLKAAGVVQVRHAVSHDARNADAEIAMYKELGFVVAAESSQEARGSKAKHTVLTAALGQLTPDPRKKVA